MNPRWLFLAVGVLSVAQPAATQPIFSPPDGAQNVCPDTFLRLSFASPPVLGKGGRVEIRDARGNLADSIDLGLNDSRGAQVREIGGARFTNFPVLISGNTAMICPHLGALRYGESYHVTVGAGVFTGLSNEVSWAFATRRVRPDTNAPQLIVAADGTGDFCTVQGAVDFVPAGNTRPVTISCARASMRKSCTSPTNIISRYAGRIGSRR